MSHELGTIVWIAGRPESRVAIADRLFDWLEEVGASVASLQQAEWEHMFLQDHHDDLDRHTALALAMAAACRLQRNYNFVICSFAADEQLCVMLRERREVYVVLLYNGLVDVKPVASGGYDAHVNMAELTISMAARLILGYLRVKCDKVVLDNLGSMI